MQNLLDKLLPQYKANQAVTEELELQSQTLWVGKTNNIKAEIEEIIWTATCQNTVQTLFKTEKSFYLKKLSSTLKYGFLDKFWKFTKRKSPVKPYGYWAYVRCSRF